MQFENGFSETENTETPERDVGGRPRGSTKLTPDEDTFKQINGLSRIQCTQREAAAVLGVHADTFRAFLNSHEKAMEAWEDGAETGKASLRRNQYKMSVTNPTMAIWLGKQWLDQTDKNDTTLRGHSGGPIEMVHLLGKLTSSVCPIDEKNDEPDSA